MGDIIDMAQAREERERENALRARELRARATCGVSNEGGVCPDCGDAIEPQRLAVIPNAVRCADCQGAREEQEKRPR